MLIQVCFKSLHIKWGVGINECALVLVINNFVVSQQIERKTATQNGGHAVGEIGMGPGRIEL
jgi:hypothetical protein